MSEPRLESQNACYAGIVNDGNYYFLNHDGTPTRLNEQQRRDPKRVHLKTPPSCVVYYKGAQQRFVGIAVDPIQYPCDHFSVQVSGIVDVQFNDRTDRMAMANMVGMDLNASNPESGSRARVLLTPFKQTAAFY